MKYAKLRGLAILAAGIGIFTFPKHLGSIGIVCGQSSPISRQHRMD